MTDAIAGHGATIAMELDPTGSAGAFTVIAELNGDISPPALSRNAEEVTPHQDNIDSHVLGVLRREPLTFSVNFIFDDQTHDHLTGLINAIKTNEVRGWRIRGPGGSADTDEWISSGQVSNFAEVNPVRDGARTAEVSVVMSGPAIKDGVAYGD